MTNGNVVTLNEVDGGLEVEEVVALDDMAEESGGAWAVGWYPGEILEGYTTQRQKTFLTEDTVSQKGDSRNLRVCALVNNGRDDRQIQETFNYRAGDLTAERKEFVKQARIEYKNIKSWPDKDAQRSSLAMNILGQLSKAALGEGKTFRRVNGAFIAADLVGKKVDIHLTINDKGYNEINGFAPAGTKTNKPAKPKS